MTRPHLHVLSRRRRRPRRTPSSARSGPAGSRRSGPMSTRSSASWRRHAVAATRVALSLRHGGAAPGLLRHGRAARRRRDHLDDDVRRHGQRDRLHRRRPRSSSTPTRVRQHGPGAARAGARRPAAPQGAESRPSSRSTCSARSPTTRPSPRSRHDHGVPLLVGRRRVPRAPTRDGRPAGSFGDASILSFNGNKIMTTSGGGALLTDDGDFAAARPLPRHPGPPAGRALRAHRDRLQLPAEQPPGRPRPGPAGAPDGDDRAAPGVARRYRDLFADVAGVELFGAPTASTTGRPDNCWLPRSWSTSDVAGWSTERPREPPARRHQIESGRCGSRCTCSRCSPHCRPTPTAPVSGSSDRSRPCPSGSALSDDQSRRVMRCAFTTSWRRAMSVNDRLRLACRQDGLDHRSAPARSARRWRGACSRASARSGCSAATRRSRTRCAARFGDARLRFYLGDVRDTDSVADAVRGADFVFHAAALKQVPSCEFFPHAGGPDERRRQLQRHRGGRCRRGAVGGLPQHRQGRVPGQRHGHVQGADGEDRAGVRPQQPDSETTVVASPLRQRDVLARLGHPAVHRAAAVWPAAHHHRADHDPVPDVARRVGRPRRARVRPGQPGRPVRQEGAGLHGRGARPRGGRAASGSRARDPGHRHPARREAARDAAEPRGDGQGRGPGRLLPRAARRAA